MKKILLLSIIVVLLTAGHKISAQELKRLTLQQVIELSEVQSPNALMAMHRFRSSYWQYRTFVAQYRPSLTLSGSTPDYSTAFSRVWNSQSGTYQYVSTNILQTIGSLSLTQNIGLTGGTISLQSDLTLENDFEKETNKYITAPLSIRVVQPLFRYNSLKWQKKIEPLEYEAAKKNFLSSIEGVHMQAVQYFFSLATAQINKQIAEMNYLNADTLWRMAQGRYQLGTIAEDELLQMQLSWLNSETARKEAEMNLRDREIRLRSFLGFNENVRIELILPSDIPDLQVDVDEVLEMAHKNNPEMLEQQLSLLNAQSNVAQAKADKGLNANLIASFGLRDQDPVFSEAYNKSNQQQTVRVGITLPILDWGLGRGRYRMAQSSLELAQVQTEQARVDFDQNLYLDVEQFNLQSEQVAIAAKSDTVAMKMYEVTKQRFLIGKIAVLELNNADTRKDQNRRAYVQALQSYWNYFYNIRSLALYDFLNRKPLETDFEKLLD
ncbi:MAG TPA: TolC family protein [Bacteroidales bacterium]|nr:TolC family protein [Bacteroidales bacterium]HPF03288.1 TolC family protein [Bacteroidales bacterium]HPR12428.1 TolC family protein [Bacteroidales bacterium]HRW84493.1 TolC family protein [Bacteroidales bacterium]